MNHYRSVQSVARRRALTAACLLTGALAVPCSAIAATPVPRPAAPAAEETTITINDTVTVAGRMSLGLLNGESKELVYNPQSGSTLSELTWSFDNVWMLGAGITVAANRWLRFNGDVWFKVTDNSSMDDYDWFVEGADWTHWSQHDDVELTTGYMLDINAHISFHQPPGSDFFGIIGFKRDNWAWDARGGSYVYSVNAFRDTTGTFPAGEIGISYEQWFNVPYIGVGFSTESAGYHFFGRVIGSPLVDASAEDTHYYRDLFFEDDPELGSMLAVDLGAAYFLSERLSLALAFHYQKYFEMKGDEKITDLTTGESITLSGDVAGMEHDSSLFTFGVHYTF